MSVVWIAALALLLSAIVYRVYRIWSVEWELVLNRHHRRRRAVGKWSCICFSLAALVGAALLLHECRCLDFISREWFVVMLSLPAVPAVGIFGFLAFASGAETKNGLGANRLYPRSTTRRLLFRGWNALLFGLWMLLFVRGLWFVVEMLEVLEVIGVVLLIPFVFVTFMALRRGRNYARRPCKAGVALRSIVWRRAK
ncbi:MAG: hypothetical protein KDD64_14560 [Bdellovibrionales bacterium]|nr:hypothetical protein [Bdellovibrionales bacterium]